MDFQAQPEAYDLLIFGSGAGSKLLAWTFAGQGAACRGGGAQVCRRILAKHRPI